MSEQKKVGSAKVGESPVALKDYEAHDFVEKHLDGSPVRETDREEEEDHARSEEEDERDEVSDDSEEESDDEDSANEARDEDSEEESDEEDVAGDVRGEDSSEEDDGSEDDDAQAMEDAKAAALANRRNAPVVYTQYSFRGIARRPSGHPVMIVDSAGDVHRAEPVDILGKRVLLVQAVSHSDYEHATFTDEPLR